ncbi:hypothetical protein CLAIMM_08315 [Cladophialophora immunda]|nr:hypothetical protein CLAIMM_08315 [Cladophialophora immunda]
MTLQRHVHTERKRPQVEGKDNIADGGHVEMNIWQLSSGLMLTSIVFLTVQNIPSKLLSSLHAIPGQPESAARKSHRQSIYHIPEQYGLTLNVQAACHDPSYALSELFFFYISSETQYLNMLQRRLDDTMRSCEGRENLALDDLHHTKQLINSHTRSIEELRLGFSTQTHRHWPPPTTLWSSSSSSAPSFINNIDPTMSAGAQKNPGRPSEGGAVQAKLIDNLAYRHRQAAHLSQRATESMNFVSNGVMLEESRRAMLKADSMEPLTCSPSSSCLCPSLRPFSGPISQSSARANKSIWILVVTLVPATAFAAVLGFRKKISYVKVARALKLRSVDR